MFCTPCFRKKFFIYTSKYWRRPWTWVGVIVYKKYVGSPPRVMYGQPVSESLSEDRQELETLSRGCGKVLDLTPHEAFTRLVTVSEQQKQNMGGIHISHG